MSTDRTKSSEYLTSIAEVVMGEGKGLSVIWTHGTLTLSMYPTICAIQ